MSGHHKFNQLIENISPDRKAKIEQKVNQVKQEMALNELQEKFWQQQTDAYVNHLQEAIALMGGELIITARFPDREVIINSLSDFLEHKN